MTFDHADLGPVTYFVPVPADSPFNSMGDGQVVVQPKKQKTGNGGGNGGGGNGGGGNGGGGNGGGNGGGGGNGRRRRQRRRAVTAYGSGHGARAAATARTACTLTRPPRSSHLRRPLLAGLALGGTEAAADLGGDAGAVGPARHPGGQRSS